MKSMQQDFGNISSQSLQIKAPREDKTGKRCAICQINSISPVFYLANGRGQFDRVCTIPYGKGVLIPVMVVEVSDKEVQNDTVDDS